MEYCDKLIDEIVDKSIGCNDIYCISEINYNSIDHFSNSDKGQIKVDDNNEKVDINTEEKENIKDLESYQQYQEEQQYQQPWSSSSDIRIVESEKLPDPHPITDTEICSKCGNKQARWWIVQTDSGDEPSTQFFRCTKCMHTWRTPKSS
ncbi:MAG TPA: zinc ribbon domain-containing protein [Candidatus Nitrosocosmicus sp.]